MVIKLYGVKMSTCTRRVITVLIEKDVTYEFVPIDFTAGEHKSPAYLTKQPFGKVPYLDDDGYIVYESRAMCKYIARKYEGQGNKLIPASDDLKAYGLFEQACSVEAFYFDGPASSIAFEKVFKAFKGLGGPDEARVKLYAAQLEANLVAYDAILAKQPYLAGEEVTLADLFHLPYGVMVKNLGFAELFSKYPNVKRWWDALESRESWAKANA